MRSTIITTCLVNAKFATSLEEAEHRIEIIFGEEFSGSNYAWWNRDVEEKTAADIIWKVGKAGRINVRSFILELAERTAEEA